MVSHDCYICYMYINQTYAASTKQEFSYKKGQKLTVKKLGGGEGILVPRPIFRACALRTCQKIGSGHFQSENWDKFIYGEQ